MEKYLLIPVSGKPVWIEVDPDHLLDDFRRFLDCDCIEKVKLSRQYGLIVDGKGKAQDSPKPYNKFASKILGGYWCESIAGDAILFAYGDRNGEPDNITSPEGLILL